MSPEDQLTLHHALHSNKPSVILSDDRSFPILEMPFTRKRYCCIDGEKYLQMPAQLNKYVTQIIRPGDWGLIIDEVILR